MDISRKVGVNGLCCLKVFNPVAGQSDIKSSLGTITATLLGAMDLVILQARKGNHGDETLHRS